MVVDLMVQNPYLNPKLAEASNLNPRWVEASHLNPMLVEASNLYPKWVEASLQILYYISHLYNIFPSLCLACSSNVYPTSLVRHFL